MTTLAAAHAAQQQGYEFTSDWVTWNEPVWNKLFARYMGQSHVSILEIGTYEGRSAIWWLEHVLTHDTARLTCVDHWWQPDRYAVFQRNLAASGGAHKTRVEVGRSESVLPRLIADELAYDVIYVDGSHRAHDVLLDGLLSLKILKPDGILLFDDYKWQYAPEGTLAPKFGIDAFLQLAPVTVIHRGYQVAVQHAHKQAAQ